MKLSDPADKLDAQADGNFGGKHNTNRRAGYSKTVTINGEEITELEWLIRRAKKDATLASGEGRKIVEHYEAQLAAVEAERDALEKQFNRACYIAQDYCQRHKIGTVGDDVFQVMRDDAERHRSTLAALREPSNEVVDVIRDMLSAYAAKAIIRAALSAAEKEVQGE